MPFKKLLSAVMFCAAVAGPPLCAAQTTGTIEGTVFDKATKKPVADAIVLLTGSSLQGEQNVPSGDDGGYRFANLQPGLFAVRVVNDGYKPFERGNIPLNAGEVYRVKIELVPNLSADK